MNRVQWMTESKIGQLYLVASAQGLQGLYWKKQSVPLLKTLKSHAPEAQILEQAVKELDEYLDGQRKAFTVPLDIQGTPFQRRVWNQLSQIPYGKTYSYKEIAKQIDSESAIRAVGTANGRNPLCIFIPCHRVIAADGSLGGYSGGLEIKSQLLDLEDRHTRIQNS